MENNISTLIVAHLNLLSENLAVYFSEDDNTRSEENSLIMQPFIDEPNEDEELLELRADLNQNVSFREMDYFMFWVYLLKFPEYKKLAQKAIAISIQYLQTTTNHKKVSPLSRKSNQKRETQYMILMLLCQGR